jgi:hypothetical protein
MKEFIMQIAMLKSNPLIDTAEISRFENDRAITLPASYKHLLLLTNGGIPLQNLVYPIIGMDLNPFGGLQVFFGLKTAEEHNLLERIYNLYFGRFPLGIVPIADNGGGDYICLDLRNGTDRVVFWDKRHFWGTGEWRESDLYHVADSFDAFLASLKPSPY